MTTNKFPNLHSSTLPKKISETLESDTTKTFLRKSMSIPTSTNNILTNMLITVTWQVKMVQQSTTPNSEIPQSLD